MAFADSGTFDVMLADPPWAHYGDPNKDAAAGKHYDLMTDADVRALPVRNVLAKNAYVFVWATCPRLDAAIETIKAWGLHYRGVGHVWVKTTQAGKIIHGQGVPPTYSKPTTELLLVATTSKRGRPVKLEAHALPQVVLAPRGEHSAKPAAVRALIEQAFPNARRIELFAREHAPGWSCHGNALGGDIRDVLGNSRAER